MILQISRMTEGLYKTEGPESGIFDIPDVCGEQTNKFCNKIPKTQVRCDFQNGGGWTVILRRKKDVPQQVNFNCSWADYERGFGDLNTEFWYGLRNIHCLTVREEVELRIEVRQENGTGQIWTYGYFEVDGPETNYTLHIGQAQGPSDGQDNMAYHNGMQFSTNDRDNDVWSRHCVNEGSGTGWWYNKCYRTILTGGHGTSWLRWLNEQGRFTYYPLAEMRLRPKNCKVTEEQSCN